MDSNHLLTNRELVHDAAFWWNVGVYMYVGRMGGNKGIEHMLTAWLDLRKQYGDTCPDLWIVGGSPSEIDTIRQQVTFYESLFTFERQGHIRWWGYLDAKGVGALLLKALVLVMHSSYEPGGRVVLEAMSQGVPVIGTPHGFARDLVADGVNGFLVSYGDAASLSHRMSHFISQPLLSHSLGYAAKETARTALASWNFFERHQDAYMTFGLTGGPQKSKAMDEPLNLIKNPFPQGLIGRFPFQRTIADDEDATRFVEAYCRTADNHGDIQKVPQAGRSVIWKAHTKAGCFAIKHPYTVFARRPIWDMTDTQTLYHPLSVRLERDLASSKLPGFAEVMASDVAAGLHLFEYLPSALSNESFLEKVRLAHHALQPLWNTCVYDLQRTELQAEVQDWLGVRDEEPKMAPRHLRAASVRVAWRETVNKLIHRYIDLPVQDRLKILDHKINIEKTIETEATHMPFCHQHGDFALEHVRVQNGQYRLIDGERAHLGWWGRDAAFVIVKCADPESSKADLVPSWTEGLMQLSKSSDQVKLVLVWILLDAVFEIARTTAWRPGRPLDWPRQRLDTALYMLNAC